MSFTLKHSSYISLVNVEGNNFKKLDIIVQCFFRIRYLIINPDILPFLTSISYLFLIFFKVWFDC
jgi:hypothetical protein